MHDDGFRVTDLLYPCEAPVTGVRDIEKLKDAAFLHAMGADNMPAIAEYGTEAVVVAHTMRHALGRIQANIQKKPKPRFGLILNEGGGLILFTRLREIHVRKWGFTVICRETGEIIREW